MELASRLPVPVLPELAERIRLREQFGISQTELGREIGVSRRTVYAWEHGASEPTGASRAKYAVILAAWSQTEKRLRNEMTEAVSDIAAE